MTFTNMKFKDFITLQRGYDLTRDELVDGNFPVVSSTSIFGYHNEYKVKGPGVVIGRSGSLGKAQYIKDDFWPHNTTLFVKDFKGNYPKFVYYFLSNFQTERAGGGAAVPTLNRNNLSGIDVDIPDPKTQVKIADCLFSYDELISNNKKQIALLEEAAQKLYKEWFVDLRFPDYENIKIIDGLPDGWSLKSILENDVFIFAKSKVQPFNGVKRYFATADVSGRMIVSEGEEITYQNRPSRAAIQPIANSVWFARMSNSYKILNCYASSKQLANDSVISSGFAGFTSCDDCYGFVYETIASDIFNEEKNRYATGTTQVSLTNEGLRKIQVLIPPFNIIKQFSQIVERYIEKSELLKLECFLLQQTRDNFLPLLVEGNISL